MITEGIAVEPYYCLPNLTQPNLRYTWSYVLLSPIRGPNLPDIIDKSNQYLATKVMGTTKSHLVPNVSIVLVTGRILSGPPFVKALKRGPRFSIWRAEWPVEVSS